MLEGEIREIDLTGRLVALWREQFTGAIRFENDGIIKIVYFKGGDILSASTNDRADSVDEILMRAGKVSREHVKQALAKRKENETLGDALLNLGFITRKELTWARRVQVVGVIRSIAGWTAGSFTIVEDYLPKRDEGTLFPLPQVIVELIVTEQDRSKLERVLDGGAVVHAKAADFGEVFGRLGLNEDAEAIVREIDGKRSAAEVATASGRDPFNTYKLIHALAILGILTAVEKPRVGEQLSLDEFASAGVADAAEMWNVEPEPAPVAPQATSPAAATIAEPAQDSKPDPTTPTTGTFQFDEEEAQRQPTLELAPMSLPPEEPTVTSDRPRSAWDDDEPAVAPEPVRMPAWDAPPRASAAVPIPVPIEPPVDATEEQWGFDDAQIETARRAAEDDSSMPPPGAKGGRRYGLLIALMIIFILAGGGYYGFLLWQRSQESPQPIIAHRAPALRPKPAVTLTVPDTPTPIPSDTSATVTTGTEVETTSTQSTNGERAPTRARAPEPAAVEALPAVVPKSGGDRRTTQLDAMARQFAANPRGRFTVQIQILCSPSNVEQALRSGGSDVWFVAHGLNGRPCYRVFWGHYATRDEAQRAMAAIPGDLRDRAAAVVSIPR